MSMMKERFSLPQNGTFIISKAKVNKTHLASYGPVNNAICALWLADKLQLGQFYAKRRWDEG